MIRIVDDIFFYTEKKILKKYTTHWEDELVVLRTCFLSDPRLFDELAVRVLCEIIVLIGKKENPPRLASLLRLLRLLQADELPNGKQLTLGGCRVSTVVQLQLGSCLF